jgi:hypothetical protein
VASILDLVWAQTDEEVEAEEVRFPEEIPEWAGLEGDMTEWDGWTVSLVRECISTIASVAEQGEEELIEAAIEWARLEIISAKAAEERVERDLARMSRERLLPDEKTWRRWPATKHTSPACSTRLSANSKPCRSGEPADNSAGSPGRGLIGGKLRAGPSSSCLENVFSEARITPVQHPKPSAGLPHLVDT